MAQQLRQIAGTCYDKECPKVFADGEDHVVVQGPLVTVKAVRDGEGLVRIPARYLIDAARVLEQPG